MKKWRYTVAVSVLATVLALPATQVQGEDLHWVDKETAPYKQLLVPARDQASSGGPVTKEEWATFHTEVLNADNYDKPIEIQNWATLLKLTVRLPKEQTDMLLKMYVYDFGREGRIKREDAVGGFVKLLSIKSLRAVWGAGDPRASDTIRDADEVSEKQRGLVDTAYREGLLDSGVKELFRPKDWLTNAEAISMGYRAVGKYGMPTDATPVPWPEGHWSTGEMQSFLDNKAGQVALHRVEQAVLRAMPKKEELDRPILPEAWHQLVISFGTADSDFVRNYTTRLKQGDTVDRSIAVVALMKLYGPSRDATEAEKDVARKRFSDAGDAFDLSKLSIAAGLNLLQGDEDGRFYPQRPLTVAEAHVLVARLAGQLAKVEPNE